jgi:ATP-dependent DNA ligase
MKTFPTLYKKTSTGALQEWTISVNGRTIITEFGQTGGAIQTTYDTIRTGKNLGKVNETTAEQQAEAEALGKWEKKSKKHYVTDPTAAMNGQVDKSFVAGGIAPMLAHVYEKQGHKIKFPAYVQPKLDGHRCIAMVNDDEVTLWTRTQKPITGVPHIIAELESLNLPDGTVLDGELYNHSYRDRFEELSSFIRTPDAKLGHEVVQYHVYDLPSAPDGFGERTFDLYKLIAHSGLPSIVYVDTAVVDDGEEMMAEFAKFLSQGYEGLMLRNADGAYVNKRSYDLIKVKLMLDSEFKIVNVEEGRGKLAGRGIFVCETENGTQFKAKMVGNIDALAHAWECPEEYIGKMLTVQYQGITNANGVPRFPVGLRLREDL